VQLELPDVTDDGMKSLAALKKLKTLKVSGGSPGVSDQGLAYICAIPSLEHLELFNTRITDQGLSSLKNLPNLQSLILCHSPNGRTQFTTAGLQDLKALTKLKKLNISGGLATDAAVNELRKALPHCAINEKNNNNNEPGSLP
jgi:internalin A